MKNEQPTVTLQIARKFFLALGLTLWFALGAQLVSQAWSWEAVRGTKAEHAEFSISRNLDF